MVKLKFLVQKNSALALLAACCLTEEKVILKGIPNIQDFRVICEIGSEIGLEIKPISEDEIQVDASKIHSSNLNIEKSSKFRTSYYFIGPMLSRYKRISLGYPGGTILVPDR